MASSQSRSPWYNDYNVAIGFKFLMIILLRINWNFVCTWLVNKVKRWPIVRAIYTLLWWNLDNFWSVILQVNNVCLDAENATIIFPTVVGAWLLAVTLGVVGGTKLLQLGSKVVGSFSYSLIFFTYAVMISSGLVVHCVYLVECGVQPPTTPVSTVWATVVADAEISNDKT